MDFWSKMLSNIADAVLPKDLDDDALLMQMDEALQEEKSLWHSQQQFLDPCVVKNFQEKWYSAYCTAEKKTHGLLFSIGLSGRKIRNVAPRFIEIYEQLPSKLQAHNNQLASQKAADAAKLILPVEGKMLDEQQLRCITKEVHNHLVLAGAGTGKTTTIIGYVKYLLKKKICMPDDILVLSFTNASAAEMSERLNKEIGRPIHAQTFHKLGLDIIASVQGKKPKIYSSDIRQFVRKQLDMLTQDLGYLRKLCVYLTYNGVEQKSEFDFETEEEYRSYLKYNPPITLKKETVKSYGELDIANFLTQNGITYVYEQEYPIDTRTSEFGQYYPDFYLPNFDVYIEYFGINRQGEVPAYFSGKNGMSAAQAYQEGIKWKRELHRKNGTRMIEVYAYEKFEEQLENMRVFFQKLIRLEIAIYYGDFCKYEELSDMCRQLLSEQNANVRQVSKIYQVGQISGLKGNNEGLDGKIASWRTLLNQNRLMDFKYSLIHYLNYYSNADEVNKNVLMRLHQGVSEMLISCMAAKFASTERPVRMNGVGSSVEAV